MTKSKQLTALKGARETLDKTYIKWMNHDDSGGHCAQGAVFAQFGYNMPMSMSFIFPDPRVFPVLARLNANAVALHPELKGAVARREFPKRTNDYFNDAPLIYVNNQLGKEAALAVFDAAIDELELTLTAETRAEPELVGVSG